MHTPHDYYLVVLDNVRKIQQYSIISVLTGQLFVALPSSVHPLLHVCERVLCPEKDVCLLQLDSTSQRSGGDGYRPFD